MLDVRFPATETDSPTLVKFLPSITSQGILSLRVLLVHAHRLWRHVSPFSVHSTSTNASIFRFGFGGLRLMVGSKTFRATSKDFPLAFVVASKLC